MTATKTLAQFIAEHKVTMRAELTDSNPTMNASDDWHRSATHWKCVLRCGRKQMTVYFSQGPAISREPSAADLLDCMASDASGWENAQGDFHSWCREYGYDDDSRTAEKTFNTVAKQAEQLEALLGAGAYSALLWHTERE